MSCKVCTCFVVVQLCCGYIINCNNIPGIYSSIFPGVASLALMQTFHYNDVIMTMIASQITSLAVVYSTVYSDADQRKHQSSASLAFVWGIHRDRTNGQLRGALMFSLMTSSCDCLSVSEVTLKDMGKIGPNHNKKQSKKNNAYSKKKDKGSEQMGLGIHKRHPISYDDVIKWKHFPHY